MRDLLVVAINMVGIIGALWKAEYAVAFYMFLTFSRLQDFAYGFATTQPWSQLAAGATLFTMLRTGILFPWRDSWINRTVLALAIWITFTSSIGISPAFSWEILSQFLKVLLMFFVAGRIIDSPRKVKILLLVVMGAFVFHGIKFGLYGLMKGFPHNLLGPGGQMADNNSFGMVMATTFPLILFAFNQWHKSGRIALLVYLPMHFSAIICTYSRGAFVNLALGSMVLLFFSRHRIRNMILFPILIASAVPLLPQAYWDRMATIKDTGEDMNKTSNASRMMLIQYGLSLFKKNALLGAGHGAYMLAAYQDLGPGHEHFTEHYPHNALILIGVEAGALGLILHVLLSVLAIVGVARLAVDKWLTDKLPMLNSLARALLAANVGYFANSLFNNYPYHELGYFLLLLSSCLIIMVGRLKARYGSQKTAIPGKNSPALDGPYPMPSS